MDMKDKRKLNAAALQSVLAPALIILFFVGVILAYYSMLYAETRERIIGHCELSAVTSAQQIDKYLTTGTDTMRLICYTLDNMLRDGRSQEEIIDYLENESIAVSNITPEFSHGIYGYINGEFLDGTGWEPKADFNPLERPWYTAARANVGRVSVVDPYLDLMTGAMMITISKTLCDARSVAAIDSSLERLQAITEDLALRGDSEMVMLLNRKYQVIAHSDVAEVGRSYLSEEGGFGSELVKALRETEGRYFSLRFGGAEYIVYREPVANDWLCLSVFDATSVFSQMRNTLIFTIVAVLLLVAVLLTVMVNAGKKTRMARELKENLSQARNDIRQRDHRIGEISRMAYRDALTGVGSKAAFNQLAEELSGNLADGAAFAVVMMDVNNLKYVNDTFGHEAGDSYLRGCCKQICDIYKHSPVFRMGGDEFVAVLQNDDYERREALAEALRTAFAEAYAREDRPAWERYSVSAGMAVAESGDTAPDQVMKRADAAMYEAKRAFKAQHGSYR